MRLVRLGSCQDPLLCTGSLRPGTAERAFFMRQDSWDLAPKHGEIDGIVRAFACWAPWGSSVLMCLSFAHMRGSTRAPTVSDQDPNSARDSAII